MAEIARIAEKCGCAIVVVRHLTKGDREKAIYRGSGSIDITAACRSVLMVGMDPDDDSRRIVAHVKTNLAPLGPSWAFTISNGRFQWLGAATLSAEDLCRKPQDPDYRTKLVEAEDFLRQLLTDGAVAATDAFTQAKDLGIAIRTLKRAKAHLGVQSRKDGDTWYWELPPSGPSS
jgi:hypothetical protein